MTTSTGRASRSGRSSILACDYLDAAIGMDLPVADEAAKVFAGQFCNAVGFGLSLEVAFQQARTQVELVLGSAVGEPRLHVAPGVDASQVYLVAPPDGASD